MAAGDKEQAGLGTAREPSSPEGSSDARRDPLIGTLVNGKYRVGSAIARGGMGRIYYATQVPLDRPVALKVVQGDGEQEHASQFLKRFLQEASILAKLQHPNVVTIFDYGRIEGARVEQYFIAMEFLAGETLTQRLKFRERLEVGEALLLGRQIARGLREAHKRGIVHRDLKPSNIILLPEGDGGEIVKIVDFGIGKVLNRAEDTQDLTQDGAFVGTPRYMAPEQFEGTAFPASDLYALGTILFQCIAGRLPFTGNNMSELMVAKLARGVPLVRDVAPDQPIPDSVEELLMRLLARRPEERPSMDELQACFLACEDEVFGTTSGRLRGNSSGPHIHPAAKRASGAPSSLGSGTRAMPAAQAVPMTSSSPELAPSSPSWRPPSHPGPYGEALRVPPTIVTAPPMAVPSSVTPAPRYPTPEQVTQFDASPHAARRSRAPLFLGLALLGVLVVGGAVTVSRLARLRRTHVPVAASTSAAVSATATAPAAPTAFVLSIDSDPPGAAVSEGDRHLGETPLDVPIDHASVASGPRTFVVKKEGYAPSHVVQGSSSESVRSVLSLAALPPEVPSAKVHPNAGAKAAAQGAGTAHAAAAAAAASNASGGPAPTDIRMKR